jgi:hypothetical protein
VENGGLNIGIVPIEYRKMAKFVALGERQNGGFHLRKWQSRATRFDENAASGKTHPATRATFKFYLMIYQSLIDFALLEWPTV